MIYAVGREGPDAFDDLVSGKAIGAHDFMRTRPLCHEFIALRSDRRDHVRPRSSGEPDGALADCARPTLHEHDAPFD